ncbi:hypothetical protein D0851_17990 [Marinobacter sp. Arc7-DN-1]|nr:hypothetical protein D0851_17990 [Marinobacter sp. Arc7-DN-1]
MAHLRQGSIPVKMGEKIEAGDPLGEMGNSGNSSAHHENRNVTVPDDVGTIGMENVKPVSNARCM